MTDSIDNPESKSDPESGWVPCCQGEISGMVDRLTRQRRIAGIGKVSALAALLLLGFGVWQSTQESQQQQAATPDGEFNYGSICCSDVMEYAAAFRKGDLDEDLTAQISQHLAECPHCRPKFEQSDNEPQAAVHPPLQIPHEGLPAGVSVAGIVAGR